jgi:hypothetical protein
MITAEKAEHFIFPQELTIQVRRLQGRRVRQPHRKQ